MAALLLVLALYVPAAVPLPSSSVPGASLQEAISPKDQEKTLRDGFRREMARSDPATRAAAATAYGEGTRPLGQEIAASRLVARTLGDALADEDLAVRAAALTELSWGREPQTVIDLMKDQVGDLRQMVENLWTRPDADSRARRADAQRLFGQACAILGRHPDDRSVDLLEGELRTLRRLGGPGNAAEALIGPLAEALLELGSEPAVDAVVKSANVYSGNVFNRATGEATARRLHQALAAFAEELGQAPPVFSERYDQEWRDWLKEHQSLLPDKLGRLKDPVEAPVVVRPDRGPWQRQPGRPERP